MRRRCWRSGASCARRGRADELQGALDRREPARHVARGVAARSRRRPARRAGRLSLLSARAKTARRLFYMSRKANNLRERVLDHFRGGASDAKARKLAAQVRRVEWTETAGELGALLLEAREVRERAAGVQPPAARRRRAAHVAVRRQRRGAAAGGARCRGAALGQRVRHLSQRARCAPRARGAGARAPVVLQVVRPGKRRRFLLRLAGRAAARAPASARSPRCCTWRASRSGSCRSSSSPGRTKGRWCCARARASVSNGTSSTRWQHLGSFDAGDEDAVASRDRAARSAVEDFDIDAYRIFMRFMRDSGIPPQPLPRS